METPTNAPSLPLVDAVERSNVVRLSTVKHSKIRFTETNVLDLRPPKGAADYTYWDDRMSGFGVRFRNGGTGSFFIQYRIGTKQRRQSLGRVGKVTLNAAKREAKSYFGQVARKVDPAIERAKAIAKASGSIEPLIQPFLDFIAAKGRSPRHIGEVTRSLKRYFKSLHPFSPDDINRAMVAAELGKIRAERGTNMADHSRAHLSVFFNWLMAEGRAEYNPVTGTNKIGCKPRERKLTEEELVAIWKHLGDDGPGYNSDNDDYSQILKLLILTGSRREEIAALSHREINFAKKQIELPGSRTKNGRDHLIPLSPLALAILKARKPREGTEFVFGRLNRGFSGWSKCKKRLDEKLGFKERWTPHDFRRTLSTEMHETLKVPPHIVEAVLNHVSGAKAGVAGVYNRALYVDEKRAALEKWGRHIKKLVDAVD